MPNIPVFNQPLPDVNVSDRAAETFAEAARHIGASGREQAQDITKAGEKIQTGLNEFSQKVEQHQDFADMLNGTHASSEMSRQHEDEIHNLLADNTIPDEQKPAKLAELYHQQQTQIDSFGQAFKGSSPKLQLWASEQADKLRTDSQRRFEADSSNASAIAIGEISRKTINNAAATTPGAEANTVDLDSKLDTLNNQIKALDLSPYMNQQDKNKTAEEVRKGQASIAARDITSMLNKDPTRLDVLTQKYGQYLTPEHQTQLQEHARTVQKRLDGEQALTIQNGIVNDFLGDNSTTGSAPQSPGGDLWSRVKGAEGGVDRQGNALTSPKGAIGISQIIPATAETVAREMGVPYDEKRLYTDQTYNESLGKRYLSDLLGRYGGNEALASAAYNAGPDRVDRWLETIGDPRKGAISEREWASKIPFDETRKYTLGILDAGGEKPTIAGSPPRLPSPVSPAQAAGAIGVGDSIAAGLIRHAGLGGKENRLALLDWSNGNTAAGGSPPSMILENIQKLPDETYAGKPVVLSSGASNRPGVKDNDVKAIRDQIDYLKDKGATVTLLGVGNKPSLAGWNDKLAEIAADKQVKFAGPLQNTGDGIHPSNPQQYQALAHSLQGMPAQAQPPATTGESTGPAQAPPSAGANKPTGNLKPFPSREQMFAKIPATVTPLQRKIIEHGIDEARSELFKRTDEERNSLKIEIGGGLEKLANGNDYDYDENTIRHYFEPKTADKLLNQLADAKEVGKQIGQIRETPLADIISTRDTLQDSLKTTEPGDYQEHFKLVHAYAEAAKRHLEALGIFPGQKNGDQADPVNYLISIDPNLRQKYLSIDKGDPNGLAEYADAIKATQDRLGVPPERQRLIDNTTAQNVTQKIISDPTNAANTLDSLKNRWGDNYQQVFSDLVTHGHLPAQYQLLEALPAQTDRYLMSRALTEQATASKKGNENFWKDVIGEKDYNTIQKDIRGDDTVQKVMRSFMDSNAGGGQVKAMIEALDTLAFAKKAFGGSGNNAATDAIKAALGQYSHFEGNARVPNNVYDNVHANAGETLRNLKLDNLTLPPGYGGVGQPGRESWLAAVKANPMWITTAKEDAIQLIDNGGRRVLDSSGSPVTVKFSDPPPAYIPLPPAEPGAVP